MIDVTHVLLRLQLGNQLGTELSGPQFCCTLNKLTDFAPNSGIVAFFAVCAVKLPVLRSNLRLRG